MMAASAGGNASADTLTSPHYQLSPTVGNSFGGSFGSSHYNLVGSGGEAAIGNGSGGSYKLSAGYVGQLQHSINLYVEPAGLVGYWPMNENSGPTVHDASGNSNDGVASGSPTWVNGKIGKALQFNGTNSYVKPANPALSTVDKFTVSAWAKGVSGAGANGSYSYIAIRAASDTIGSSVYWLGVNSLGDYAASVNGDGSGNYGSTGVAADNSIWHQLTLTYDGGVYRVYLDGALKYSHAVSITNTTTGNQLSFGDTSVLPGYRPFDGDIDDVKIYDRALSTSEVEADYQSGLDGFNSGLVIPALAAGSSQTVDADVIVSADAPYSLLMRETGLLTDINDGTNAIPSIGGSIASPATWNEGTTVGLGFTITSGPNGVPAKWSSGSKYAAVPITAATSFYDRSGFSGGAKDVIGVQYRLGVSGDQPAGQYRTNMVYTATMTP